MSNCLDPVQAEHFFGLQRLSADDTSRQRNNHIIKIFPRTTHNVTYTLTTDHWVFNITLESLHAGFKTLLAFLLSADFFQN